MTHPTLRSLRALALSVAAAIVAACGSADPVGQDLDDISEVSADFLEAARAVDSEREAEAFVEDARRYVARMSEEMKSLEAAAETLTEAQQRAYAAKVMPMAGQQMSIMMEMARIAEDYPSVADEIGEVLDGYGE